MPVTLKHLISYPLGTVAPNFPVLLQTLAESVETALNLVIKPKNGRFNMVAPKSAAAGAGVTWGPIQVETGAKADWTQNNDFAVVDNTATDGRIRITKAGIYSFHSQINPSTNPGNLNYAITVNGEKTATSNRSGTYGDWEMSVCASGLKLAVGDLLSGYQANSSGVSFAVWANLVLHRAL